MNLDNHQGKVLIVTPHLQGLGGVANYYKSILPFLLKKEHLSIGHFVVGSVRSKNKFLHPLTDQINFYRKIQGGYEIVHVNPSLNFKSFIRDGLFIRQAKKNGIPVIVFFRGWDKKFAQRVQSFLLILFRFFYGKSDAFIVLASEFKNKLRKWGIKAPIYLQTTTVDHNLLDGFDIEIKVQNLLERKKTRILYLARLERDKGVFEIIEAIRILRERQIHVDLSIAGDGTVRQEIENYVQGVDLLTGSIKFLGYVRGQEKADTFTDHDIYCLPSYGEGLPNSVLEALAFGMPVITCSVGGLADIFHDGKMGAFVPPREPKAIADKIEQFVLDRQKMAATARYNFQYAKRFLAPNVADSLSKIYRETLNIDKNSEKSIK